MTTSRPLASLQLQTREHGEICNASCTLYASMVPSSRLVLNRPPQSSSAAEAIPSEAASHANARDLTGFFGWQPRLERVQVCEQQPSAACPPVWVTDAQRQTRYRLRGFISNFVGLNILKISKMKKRKLKLKWLLKKIFKKEFQ